MPPTNAAAPLSAEGRRKLEQLLRDLEQAGDERVLVAGLLKLGLAGDRLGCFNLSLQGHSNCLEFLARFKPTFTVQTGPAR